MKDLEYNNLLGSAVELVAQYRKRSDALEKQNEDLRAQILSAVNWIDAPEDEEVSRSEVDRAVRILRKALEAKP
jgi:hypothetical protein